jgi:type I restriction enzyme M protein
LSFDAPRRGPPTIAPTCGDERLMPPVTKEAQRAEVHKTIWRIADDLRGSVDGWDFKSYVIGMLFYRFISENLAAYINTGERAAGEP